MPKQEWYASWFNTREYLELYKHRDEEDAKKIISQILQNVHLQKNARVLDLACGKGRHSLLFAKKGFNVVGVDLSRYLISQARNRLNTEYRRYRGKLRFEIKDMRNFSFAERFELVVNIFTSFGYFENDSDNEKVIKCISRSLKRNGYFVIDFLNKEQLKKKLIPYTLDKHKDKILLQLRRITDSFVFKDIIIVKKHDSVYDFKKYNERIRVYSLDNFRKMFMKYKMKLLKIFGDYDGKPFENQKSPRLILIAQRV